MTKVLYVLRHAQSAGKQSGQSDYDRPLIDSGTSAINDLGNFLKVNSIRPEFAIVSGALRAKHTFEILNQHIFLPGQRIQICPDLYEADLSQWLAAVSSLSQDLSTVLLVGHNPTLSILVSHFLTREVDLGPGQMTAITLPIDSWPGINLLGKGDGIFTRIEP